MQISTITLMNKKRTLFKMFLIIFNHLNIEHLVKKPGGNMNRFVSIGI